MNEAENDKCSQLDGKFCTLIPSRARGCSFQTAVLNSRPLCGELLPEMMNEEKKLRVSQCPERWGRQCNVPDWRGVTYDCQFHGNNPLSRCLKKKKPVSAK